MACCCIRAMGTFPISHEAPLAGSMSPKVAAAATIEEKTLSNGVKIIARNGPSQVRILQFDISALH